ncbi:hypothetical protein C1X62_26835 [Pseudomonas sp. FW215-R3]|nr:hypothetical protein C1X62_26835 [Pseudomonas sp. FW215-R3]
MLLLVASGHSRTLHQSLEIFQTVSRNPCGSELARDDGVPVNRDVECKTAIASKRAPTEW